MPTYCYACTSCEHRFDAAQAFTDSSLTECPSCSGRLRKLFSAVGIVFKGSGFYRTDSRSAPVTAGESNGDAKSDAKSGAKPDGSSSEKSSSEKSSSGRSSSEKSSSSSTSAAARSSTPAAAAS